MTSQPFASPEHDHQHLAWVPDEEPVITTIPNPVETPVKNKRTGLIIAAVIAVLVVAGGIAAVALNSASSSKAHFFNTAILENDVSNVEMAKARDLGIPQTITNTCIESSAEREYICHADMVSTDTGKADQLNVTVVVSPDGQSWSSKS